MDNYTVNTGCQHYIEVVQSHLSRDYLLGHRIDAQGVRVTGFYTPALQHNKQIGHQESHVEYRIKFRFKPAHLCRIYSLTSLKKAVPKVVSARSNSNRLEAFLGELDYSVSEGVLINFTCWSLVLG